MLMQQVIALLGCGMFIGYCTACIVDILREPNE